MYLVRKKCQRGVNVNKDKDLYSCFVLVVCEFCVFHRHGICDSSNKIQIKGIKIMVHPVCKMCYYNNSNNIIIISIIIIIVIVN